MNTSHLSVIGALVLAAVSCPAPATAQEESVRQLPPLHVPIHTAADDEGVSYGIWAAAESYKASFHDGMTFVPYLGSEYPHNQPWSWRTTAATVGGVPLFEPGAVAERMQGEYRYEYRFAGVTEAYDVRVDGLEQTFVVHRLPARGDLVITGEVTSLLRAPRSDAAQQALTFVDDRGTPIVGYGKAWALDGNGARTPVTTAYREGRITLTVPGEWLARAALPVVVDPMLTRVQVGTGNVGSTINSVDVSYSWWTSANVLVVATYTASQFDDDVYAWVCNNDFSSVASVYYDVTSSYSSNGAKVAYVDDAYRWVIVFRRYFAQNPIRVSVLRCHVHDLGVATASTSISGMATPVGLNDWRPDIGGVREITSGSHALVVFQREDNTGTAGHWAETNNSSVYGVLFDATTTAGTFGAPFVVESGSQRDYERPSVNQSAEGGSSFSWVCVMQRYTTLPGGSWVAVAKRIANSGSVASHEWVCDVSGPAPLHHFAPVIAGADGRYAVALATTTVASQPTKSSNIRGTSVWTQRLDWPHGAAQHTPSHPPVELIGGVDRIYETGAIAYDWTDASHFAVGCRTLGTAQPSALAMRVGFRGELTEGPFTLHSQAGSGSSQVACTFGAGPKLFQFVHGVSSGTAPTYANLMYYPPVVPEQSSGLACNTAAISWEGNQQIGSEFNEIRVSGASSTSLHITLASTASLDVPILLSGVEPGCRLLVDAFGPGYIGILDTRVGSYATWQIPLLEWYAPTTLYFQDWILANGTLTGTQRLVVPIAK